MRVSVTMGPQGRIVVPVEVRRALGLEQGDRLVVRVEDGRLVLETPAAILARIQQEFAEAVPPGTSMVDDLIEERRAEAQREAALDRAREHVR